MKTDAILISIRPVFVQRLLAGTKTVEFRRIRPKVRVGQVVLIYACSPISAVVGWGIVGSVDC
jgi:predicted transcriptional regulator